MYYKNTNVLYRAKDVLCRANFLFHRVHFVHLIEQNVRFILKYFVHLIEQNIFYR